MGLDELTLKNLKEIFSGRDSDFKDQWESIKKDFIHMGMEGLVNEEFPAITFYIVYSKMVNMSDYDIYTHLIEEFE